MHQSVMCVEGNAVSNRQPTKDMLIDLDPCIRPACRTAFTLFMTSYLGRLLSCNTGCNLVAFSCPAMASIPVFSLKLLQKQGHVISCNTALLVKAGRAKPDTHLAPRH